MNKSLPLLSEINTVTEIDLSALGKKIKGAFTKPEPEPEPEDRARRGEADTGETALASIVTDLMDVSSSDHRLVLFLSAKDLVTLYLKKGGGGAVIDNMDDAELTSLATSISTGVKSGKLVHFTKPYLFSDFISPPTGAPKDRAVILDVPAGIWSALERAATEAAAAGASDENKQAFKKQLRTCMLHKYYILTLNISKAKAIRRQMDSKTSKGVDGWVEVFDPRVIENFPKYQTLQAAKDEWDEAHAPAPSPSPPPPPPPPAGVTPELVMNSIMTAFGSSGKFTAPEIAKGLKTSFSSLPKADVLAALGKLTGGLDSTLLADIGTAITADTSWA